MIERCAMKYVKNIGIPVLFLVGYLFLNIAIRLASPDMDTVIVAVFSDLIIWAAGVLYFKFYRQDARIFDIRALGSMFVLMVPFWISVQIMASYIIENVSDIGVNAYMSAVDANPVAYSILTLVIAPITEEILMRGIMFRHLRNIAPFPVAALVSAFVFAFLHGTTAHMYIGMMFGMGFAVIYEYTGQLRYPVLAHVLSNLLSILGGTLPLPNFLFHAACFIPMNIIWVAVLVFACLWLDRQSKLVTTPLYIAQNQNFLKNVPDDVSNLVRKG